MIKRLEIGEYFTPIAVPLLALNTLEQLHIEAYNSLMSGEDYQANHYPYHDECEELFVSDIMHDMLGNMDSDTMQEFLMDYMEGNSTHELRGKFVDLYESNVQNYIDTMLIEVKGTKWELDGC